MLVDAIEREEWRIFCGVAGRQILALIEKRVIVGDS